MTPALLDRIATWADKARDATSLRDELIRQAVADGHTLRAVGDAAGLSHAGVRRIVAR